MKSQQSLKNKLRTIAFNTNGRYFSEETIVELIQLINHEKRAELGKLLAGELTVERVYELMEQL